MPAMHSPAVHCCLCVVGVFIFLVGLIMFSIGVCLILNYGIWENELQIPDFDSEEGKKKVGIILTSVGILGMLVSVFVSLSYLCRGKKNPPTTCADSQSKSTNGNNSARNGIPQCVNINIKEKPTSQRLPVGPYSRAFTKPHRKVTTKRKIRQTSRLDRIQEAATGKASEVDLPLAAYDDDIPDSETSQGVQTKADTTDTELTSEPRTTYSFPPIKPPMITKTTPSENYIHTASHHPVSDTSDMNEEYDDVFAVESHSFKSMQTIDGRHAIPGFSSNNSSFSSKSTIGHTGSHSIDSNNKLPDIETVFHKRHVSHHPLNQAQMKNIEKVDVENDSNCQAARVSENSNFTSGNNYMNPHSVITEENKVRSWFESCSEKTIPFHESNRIDSLSDDKIAPVNSKTTYEERKVWYLGTVNTLLSNQSDDSIRRTDKHSLLDRVSYKDIDDNIYSQEYIPMD